MPKKMNFEDPKLLVLPVELTEKDMVDAIAVREAQVKGGFKAVENHSEVWKESLITKILFFAEAGDKDKVFSYACQLLGFVKRSSIDKQITEQMDDFLANQNKEDRHDAGTGNEL